MALGYYLEAEYESGYVHREQPEDHSPYVRGKNIFNDILEHRPEAVHGKMVRFALVGPEHTNTVDWTTLPDNARPIYSRDMEQDSIGGEIIETRMMKQIFGYQYNNPDGKNVKEITEI